MAGSLQKLKGEGRRMADRHEKCAGRRTRGLGSDVAVTDVCFFVISVQQQRIAHT